VADVAAVGVPGAKWGDRSRRSCSPHLARRPTPTSCSPTAPSTLRRNWMDYKLLRVLDFPTQVQVIFGDSYDPVGPFGAYAAGEALRRLPDQLSPRPSTTP
jgi:hypothetical protein